MRLDILYEGTLEKRDGLGWKHCVRLSARSAVKIQRENIAGGNDEETAEFSRPFDDAAQSN